MSYPCVSQNLTGPELNYDRPVTSVVADHTAYSTGDGGFGNPGTPGTTIISQSVDWTNNTGLTVKASVLFLRPWRSIRTNDPLRAYLSEFWAMTSGTSPAVPVINTGAINSRFGGGTDMGEGCNWWSHHEDPMVYAPFGQLTITNGQQVRVRYECRIATEGSGFVSEQYVYSRNHRIVILADLTSVL